MTETVSVKVIRALRAGVTPLKAWREGRGLTQAVLAEHTGLLCNYLAQLGAGTREPSLSALRRLSASLDLLADDLIPPARRRG